MKIHLISGGARGGKSRFAEQLATRLGGDHVTFIATARASDDEMERRIASHRAARPEQWVTVEAPVGAHTALRDAGTDVVLLDCLTLSTANILESVYERGETKALAAMRRGAEQLVAAAQSRGGDLIVVTNEVGFGIHPETAAGRWFRDGLGLANQLVAAAADDVVMMVCGIPLRVKPAIDRV